MATRSAGTYVEVLYDYTYTGNNGEKIAVQQGDECLLLKKANVDWWSVLPSGLKKPLYVPANYVREKPRSTPKTSRKLDQQTSLTDEVFENGNEKSSKKEEEKSNNNSEPLPEGKDSEGEKKVGNERLRAVIMRPKSGISIKRPQSVPPPPPEKPRGKLHPAPPAKPKVPQPEGSEKSTGSSRESLDEMVESSESPEQTMSMPEYANLGEILQHMKKNPPKVPSPEGPHYMNVLEVNMKGLPLAPQPPALSSTPVKEFEDNWAMYMDEASGRQFYYNTETKESTWSPPRGLVSKESTASEDSGLGTSVKPTCNSFGTPVKLVENAGEDAKVDPSEASRALLSRVAIETSPSLVPLRSPGGGSPRSPRFFKSDKRLSMPVTPTIPMGWTEELSDTGERFFRNQISQDRWMSSVDDNGRTYFYREDSSESSWVLPELASPQTYHRRLASKQRTAYGQHSLRSDNRPRVPVTPPVRSANSSPTPLLKEQHPLEANGEPSREGSSSPRVIPARLPIIPDLDLEVVTSDLPTISVGFSDLGARSIGQMGLTNDERIRDIRGILNRTKVMESGKKVKKNWCSSYVVTTGQLLYFYKDPKAAQPKPSAPNGKPEVTLDLQGATVLFGSQEKSSRKNVFHLCTAAGTEFLFQHDDHPKLHEWYITLRQNINLLPACSESHGSEGSLGSLDESLEMDSSFHEDKVPASPKLRFFNKKDKGDKGSTSGSLERQITLEDSSLTQSEKNVKIRDRLRQFFSKRPDIEFLKEKGIYKDGVFGSTLSKICEREKSAVPRFVVECLAAIEKRGLDIDGLYRVSGNLAQIQKLRFTVDHNEKYDLDNTEIEVHVLCGALKLFFRELKEPLIPVEQLEGYVSAIQRKELSGKRKTFKDLIKCLPRPNRETLRELLQHLTKVKANSSVNRMQSQNIAIVFGPTLMWAEVESANMAVALVYQNQIVEYLLQEYKNLF